jgi:hypothetical protein
MRFRMPSSCTSEETRSHLMNFMVGLSGQANIKWTEVPNPRKGGLKAKPVQVRRCPATVMLVE